MKIQGWTKEDLLDLYKTLRLAYEVAQINAQNWIVMNRFRFKNPNLNSTIASGHEVKAIFDRDIQTKLVQLQGKLEQAGYSAEYLSKVDETIKKEAELRLTLVPSDCDVW